jgi:hypothetical protein
MKTEIINKVVEALKEKVYKFEETFMYGVYEEEGMIECYPIADTYYLGNLQWFGEVCTFFDVILSVGLESRENKLYIRIH